MLSSGQKFAYQNLYLACDQAGLDLKDHLLGRWPFLPWRDLGTNSSASVDYPDYAQKLCNEMQPHLADSCGILICGSGQGMVIQANRFAFIRAALCTSVEAARLARAHNDANVLCLGARMISKELAESIVQTYLQTNFEGGRHQARIDKLC
jgi:ribose 5-phosphate isomerase B